jgi:hypothetical protein
VRILHVIHSVDPRGGGVIEGIKQLSAPMVAQGHTVEVLSLDKPGTPWPGGLPFHPVGDGSLGYGYARGSSRTRTIMTSRWSTACGSTAATPSGAPRARPDGPTASSRTACSTRGSSAATR